MMFFNQRFFAVHLFCLCFPTIYQRFHKQKISLRLLLKFNSRTATSIHL